MNKTLYVGGHFKKYKLKTEINRMRTIRILSFKEFIYGFILFAFLSLLSLSCSCNRSNQEGDKREAEKITNKFYNLIIDKQYRSTFPLLSNSFWKETDTSKFLNFLETADIKLGKIKEFELNNWQTFVSAGSITSGDYILQYKTKRDSIDSQETFTLKYEKEKGILIVGYNITTEGFTN